MSAAATNKNYPVSAIWLLKPLIRSFVGIIITIMFLLFSLVVSMSGTNNSDDSLAPSFIFFTILFFALFGPFFSFIISFLKRATFDYSFEDNFITLHQGIITRSQRNIPFAVIQDVIIKQDLTDRILGLTTFMVENAVQDQSMNFNKYQNRNRYQMDTIGFSGNKVTIPGLKYNQANELKQIVLERMKANQPHRSNTGGL